MNQRITTRSRFDATLEFESLPVLDPPPRARWHRTVGCVFTGIALCLVLFWGGVAALAWWWLG